MILHASDKVLDKEYIKYDSFFDYTNVESIIGTFVMNEEGIGLELPNLTRIEGSLLVRGTSKFSVPKLESITESLDIEGSVSFSAPLLKRVNFTTKIYQARDFDLSSLRSTLALFPGNFNDDDFDEIYQAQVEEIPTLLIEYGRNPLMTSILKNRLKGVPTHG